MTPSAFPVGWIYLIVSPAFDGWTKIGLTSTTLDKRLKQYHTSSPFRCHSIAESYEVYGTQEDLRAAEKLAFDCIRDNFPRHLIKNEWVQSSPAVVDMLIRGELEKYSLEAQGEQYNDEYATETGSRLAQG